MTTTSQEAEVDFSVFFENSSSTEAIIDYAEGKTKTFAELKRGCWDRRTKYRVNQMKKRGHSWARQAARQACKNNGNDIETHCPNCKRSYL